MEPEKSNNKPKLLIIEDDYENQILLQAYLKKNFSVTICDSEESFHERLNEDTYEIFLVDIALGSGKNGLDLTKELRATEKYSAAPIICLSAHVFPADKENAFNAGVDAFLPRPIFNKDLLAALVEVYEKRTGKTLNI